MHIYFPTKTLKFIGLFVGLVILIGSFISSIILGLTDINLEMVISSYTNFDGSKEQLIIKTTRLPRALIATVVGASLAIAGALMQALTRNPLADPGLFGLNAGAGFLIVFAISFLSISSLSTFTWLSFLGAGITAIIVYFLGSIGRDGLTPMKLTLAGAAMQALLSSLTQGMLVINETALDEVLFWLAGSVVGRKTDTLLEVLPYLVIGWLIAYLLASSINIFSLGEDVAKGLGQKTWLVKVMTAFVIILMAGGSVAIAGPIVFIGIVVPHIARALVGTDYRWILPYCAVLGAILLLAADIGARYIIMPKEVPVGVMTAFIGAPFFIYVVRKGGVING